MQQICASIARNVSCFEGDLPLWSDTCERYDTAVRLLFKYNFVRDSSWCSRAASTERQMLSCGGYIHSSSTHKQ